MSAELELLIEAFQSLADDLNARLDALAEDAA